MSSDDNPPTVTAMTTEHTPTVYAWLGDSADLLDCPTTEFSGTMVPVQLRLPADLVQSIRLIAIAEKTTISKLVMSCLTTGRQITNAGSHHGKWDECTALHSNVPLNSSLHSPVYGSTSPACTCSDVQARTIRLRPLLSAGRLTAITEFS